MTIWFKCVVIALDYIRLINPPHLDEYIDWRVFFSDDPIKMSWINNYFKSISFKQIIPQNAVILIFKTTICVVGVTDLNTSYTTVIFIECVVTLVTWHLLFCPSWRRILLLLFLPFCPLKGLFLFLEFFLIRCEVKGQGCHVCVCTDHQKQTLLSETLQRKETSHFPFKPISLFPLSLYRFLLVPPTRNAWR